MDAKELYLLAVKENGLSDHEMEKLSPDERKLLTRGENGKFWLHKEVREKFTVALTGETTFSIVCIKPDDSQISNFVTVKLTI